MRALLFTLAVLLSFTFASAQSAEQFTLKLGQQKTTKAGRITVKFLNLEEDSRCPTDVNCVWAGVARIKVQVRKNGKAESLELNTNDHKTAVFQGYSITLKDLTPRQSTTSKYSPSAYSATFTVSKAKR